MLTSRFGLGLAALGRPAYINLGRELPPGRSVAALRTATAEVLDAAYAAGIRWVDTARSYGRAEEFLAAWLAKRHPTDLQVSSKWGYAYVGDWRLDAPVHEVKEHTLPRFQAQLEESRTLLGEHLDLYQVHSLMPDSPLFTDEPLLVALADSGLRLGFSTSGPHQSDTIHRALDLEVNGRRLFSAVQSTWNPLEPAAGPALAAAAAAGCHVLVKEPLANGRLAVDPPAPVRRLAEAHGVGPDAIALAAALANPWASTVLLGPSTADQLHANLRATEIRLDPAELAELAEPAEQYWRTRSALGWS